MKIPWPFELAKILGNINKEELAKEIKNSSSVLQSYLEASLLILDLKRDEITRLRKEKIKLLNKIAKPKVPKFWIVALEAFDGYSEIMGITESSIEAIAIKNDVKRTGMWHKDLFMITIKRYEIGYVSNHLLWELKKVGDTQ